MKSQKCENEGKSRILWFQGGSFDLIVCRGDLESFHCVDEKINKEIKTNFKVTHCLEIWLNSMKSQKCENEGKSRILWFQGGSFDLIVCRGDLESFYCVDEKSTKRLSHFLNLI
jgi:hypothetical protein